MKSSVMVRTTMSIPEGHDRHREQRLADHRPEEDPFQSIPDQGRDGEGGQHVDGPLHPFGEAGQIAAGNVEDGGEGGDQEGAQPGEGAVGEVDHRVALKMITKPIASKA